MKPEFIIPVIIALILIAALIKKVDIVGAFTTGAKEGLGAAVKIIPIMLLLVFVVAAFRSSGLANFLNIILSPVTSLLRIPKELTPMVLIRPVSGSGALALLSDMLAKFGADSFLGRAACVMASSTETTLYTISIYCAAAGYKKSGIALPVALLADLFAAVAAATVVGLFFR